MAHVNFTGVWQDIRFYVQKIFHLQQRHSPLLLPGIPKYRWKRSLVESAGLMKVREGYTTAEAIKKGWHGYKSCRRII